jgi:hypothetical protein
MRTMALMFTCLVALSTFACKRAGWQVRLWVGTGRVEGTPDGSRVATVVAVTNSEGAYPDTDMVVNVKVTGEASSTNLSIPANKGVWSGWIYYTDGHVWPTSDIEATTTTPEGKEISAKRHYTSGGTPLDFPATQATLDTVARQVVCSIESVPGGVSYRFWLGRGGETFNIAWGSSFEKSPFAFNVPFDSLAAGQDYTMWGLADNFDMPAIKDGPAGLNALPENVRSSLGRGPQFTLPGRLATHAAELMPDRRMPGAIGSWAAD